VGARLGFPLASWSLHQLHGRLDLPLGRSARVRFNPGLALLTGNSPNGANPGTMTALTGGHGLQMGVGSLVLIPSVTGVLARSERTSYGVQIGPETTAFLSFAMALAFHR
jgi:hypothetical protein